MKKFFIFVVLLSIGIICLLLFLPAIGKNQERTEEKSEDNISSVKLINEDPNSPFYLTGDNERALKKMVPELRENFTKNTSKPISINYDLKKYKLAARQINFKNIESSPKREEVIKGRNLRLVRLTPVELSGIGKSRYFIPPDESTYEYLSKEVRNKYVAINYLGEYFTLPPNKITINNLPRLRDLYNRGLLFQMLGDSSDGYPIPKRNPINFHPGTTVRTTFLEEIILDSNTEKLPNFLEQYRGFPISKFYHVNDKFEKADFAGFLVDVAVSKCNLSGKDNLMILKRFYPNGSTDVFTVTTLLSASKSISINEIISSTDKSQFLFLPEKNENGLNITYSFAVMDIDMTETVNTNVHSLARPYYLMGLNCEKFLNFLGVPIY